MTDPLIILDWGHAQLFPCALGVMIGFIIGCIYWASRPKKEDKND